MSKNIVINLDKVNQPQAYTGTTESETEVFQYEAIDIINGKLELFLDEVKEIDKNPEINNIYSMRRHDTIFIDGARGIGKTAFLLNIQTHIKEDIERQLHFFHPIDPTLLQDSEDFLSVILGNIVSGIQECNVLKNHKEDQHKIKEYYDSLNKVSESLSAINALKNEKPKGIDEIAYNASSIVLENNVHKFLSDARNLLGKKILILLIDDVDMAFEKGFHVLETIRKFLASPYLIPIVSGDGKLYKRLIKNQFIKSYSNSEFKFELKVDSSRQCEEFEERHENALQRECEQYKEDKNKIDHMVSQYFNKVMPNDSRIALKPIFEILMNHKVAIKIFDEKYIAFTTLKDLEIQSINNKIYRKKYTELVFLNNTRSLIQYLAKKREIYKSLSQDWLITKEEAFEKAYSEYAPSPKYDNQFRLMQKNLALTADFYRLSPDFNKNRLSIMLSNDIQAYKNSHLSTYDVFMGDLFSDNRLKDRYFNMSNEKLQEKLYIFKGSNRKNDRGLSSYFDETTGWDYLLLRLFTHDDYYGTSSSTRFHFFTGKFIQFMFFTMSIHEKINLNSIEEKYLDSYNDEWLRFKEANEEDIISIYNTINEICASKPFSASFPDHDYMEEDEVEDDVYQSYFEDDEYDTVLRDVIRWNKNYVSIYSITFNSIQIYRILEKYFINLNIAKGFSYAKVNQRPVNIDKLIQNDKHPLRFIYRSYMILVNAIGYFEVESIPSNTNIAVTDNKFTENSIKNSQAYRQNIAPLVDTPSAVSALRNHPLILHCISLLKDIDNIKDNGRCNNIYCDLIRYENKEENKKRNKKKIPGVEVEAYRRLYYKIFKRMENITEDNVRQFFNEINSHDDRKEILERYNYLLTKSTSKPAKLIEEIRKNLGIEID